MSQFYSQPLGRFRLDMESRLDLRGAAQAG